MKSGRSARLHIEWTDDQGRGRGPLIDLTRPDAPPKPGEARFVIPGEIAEGVTGGRLKGVTLLRNFQLTQTSPDRIVPECPHAGVCGGCPWAHIAYPRQLELKRQAIDRAFSEAGLDLRVREAVPAEATKHHRNRMDYSFGPDGELGLREPGRWDRPIDLETCLMLSEPAVEILRRVRAWAKAHALPGWNPRSHTGLLRALVIREGKNTGERMAVLVASSETLPHADALIETLSPLVTSLYHGINPGAADVSTAKELRLLSGAPELRETIGNVTYRIPPNGFFQTNSAMAAKLLEGVRAHVLSGEHERLLDLYCGAGFFSLALARDVKEALGVELDAPSIDQARKNAAANSIQNARFEAAPAEALSWAAERPDVVIVDPPRAGLHPRVRETLLEHRPPRIVYVSCNYRSLALDLSVLGAAYRVDDCRAYDLFPQTPHVETVVHLIKK